MYNEVHGGPDWQVTIPITPGATAPPVYFRYLLVLFAFPSRLTRGFWVPVCLPRRLTLGAISNLSSKPIAWSVTALPSKCAGFALTAA
jgi:hypothetical protein